MWDSTEVCEGPCPYSIRSKKMSRYESDLFEDDKENNSVLSPIKCEDISLYGSNEERRVLEDHDGNSQDSGYGTIDNRKYLSCGSPICGSLRSFESGSLCSMEEDSLEEFGDMEPLENKDLPKDFNKLISGKLNNNQKNEDENESPRINMIRPLFRRALSLQNTTVTPNSSRVRSCLFKTTDTEVRCTKRVEPPADTDTEEDSSAKRTKIAEVPTIRPKILRPFSTTEECIISAVQRSSTEPDLIGDFSKNYSLPLTRGRHQDLKSITPSTLAQLMNGDFTSQIASFKVLDCRYPYEFEGGHISGAINVYTKDQCLDLLNNKSTIPVTHLPNKRHILVFHCEFSSERGPNLYRYLRKEDRSKNESTYPMLNYPEMYLLEGGYKRFYEEFSEMCVPIAYKEMLHPDHEKDLRHFRQKSKTWNMDSRQRQRNHHFKRLL